MSDEPAQPPERDAAHEPFRGLLADASRGELRALRHLLTCRLCRELARVVLVEIPTLERPAGAVGRRPRRRS